MSFLTNKLFKRPYDPVFIIRLHSLLSEHIDGLELIWKKKSKVINDPQTSTSVEIKLNGKAFFIQLQNESGTIQLDSLNEEQKETVLKLIAQSGLLTSPPSFSLGLGCMAAYIALILFNLILRGSEDSLLLMLILGSIFCIGIGLALVKTQATIGTIIYFIGAILTAPGSLLSVPLFVAIKRSEFYKLVQKRK